MVIALCPFYVARRSRWAISALASVLRSRHVLIAALVALALALPFIGVLLVPLGWVAQLTRLRELLPFAALETLMRRLQLVSLLWGLLASAWCSGSPPPSVSMA
ncbi:MAG: hypothetical protein U0263_39095 [Polyangiaceae bacterium]